jgi:uncharacterized protein (TIRG00374 family)
LKSNQNGFWKSARRWLPGVVISIVALAVVFKLARWQELVLAFSAIQPINLIIAIILLVLSLFTRSMVWWILLGRQAPYKRTFNIISIGYLLNNIFPLRAGEIGRALLMGNVSGLGPLYVLSTIIIERTYDLAMASGILLATLPMALSYALGIGVTWAEPVAISTLALVIIGLCSLYLIARNSDKVKEWIDRLGDRSKWLQKYVIPHIESLLNGLNVLTQPKQFILSIFWILICWALYITIYYIILLPIVPYAPLWWAVFSDGVVALGVAVPSAPGGVGVWEASIVGSLSIFGVSTSSALAYALLVHFLNFAVIGVFGFYGLAREGQSLTSLFSKIQREKFPTS